MFFSKSRYPLPKFPPQIRTAFKQVCVELKGESWKEFLEEVKRILPEKLAESNAKEVQQLVRASEYLLDRYESFHPKQKALAAGAIRYFIAENDPLPEGVFASGLVDDAKVMNHVLEKLGISECFVDID